MLTSFIRASDTLHDADNNYTLSSSAGTCATILDQSFKPKSRLVVTSTFLYTKESILLNLLLIVNDETVLMYFKRNYGENKSPLI